MVEKVTTLHRIPCDFLKTDLVSLYNYRIHKLSFADRRSPAPGAILARGTETNGGCAAILEKRSDRERANGEGTPDRGLRDITQKLLVALIESEINSAFIFVAVARTAYLAARFSDGDAALSKAEAIHAQANELARDSCGEAQQAIADRLRELRQAIDGLMAGEGGK